MQKYIVGIVKRRTQFTAIKLISKNKYYYVPTYYYTNFMGKYVRFAF